MAGRPKIFDQQRALATATDVFWKHGYEAASMDLLLKEMGINRQSAYDTFGTKRELFLAALRDYVDQRSKQIVAALTNPAISPIDRIRTFLHRLADRTSCGLPNGCLITNSIIELAPHDPDVKTITTDLLKKLETILTQVLVEAVKARELAPAPTPRQLARLILVTFEGALVLSKTDLAQTTADALSTIESLLHPPNS